MTILFLGSGVIAIVEISIEFYQFALWPGSRDPASGDNG